MANTLLTPDQITNHGLMILHQKLNFIGNVNRDYDKSFAEDGAKIGDTLRIRLPNEYKTRRGPNLQSQDTNNRNTSLKVVDQVGVDMHFTSVDLTMHIDDFSENILEPAMAVLASDIESSSMAMYQDVYQQVDSIGNPVAFKKMLTSGKILTDALTPYDKRCLSMNTDDNLDMVDDLKGLFNAGDKLSQNYKEGRLAGPFGGFSNIYENTLWPRHFTGSNSGTGYQVNGAVTEGASTLSVDTGSGTLKKGDIITIAGVNRVHPETKHDTGKLQQFVVTEDFGGGTGSVSIAPSMIADSSSGSQNISGLPANNAAITKSGGTDVAHGMSMAFHKDAFAFATADLVMPKGVDMASRKVKDGISMRLVRQYDINSDNFPVRFDVLFGYKTIRPQLACRIAAN